jgi:hypothetical protein
MWFFLYVYRVRGIRILTLLIHTMLTYLRLTFPEIKLIKKPGQAGCGFADAQA